MADIDIVKPVTLDILDRPGTPALSSTSDMPIVETKPDAQNEGKPPDLDKAVPPKEEAEVSPAEGEAEQLEESATSTTEEPTGQPTQDKVPRGVGKRLAELVKQRDEEKAEKLRLMALLEKQHEKETEVKVVEDPEPEEPRREDFSDPDVYDRAQSAYVKQLALWHAKREVTALREQDKQEAERRAADEEQRKVIESYQARQEQIKQKHPDFDEVLAQASDVVVSGAVVHAILTEETGPELKYYLAKHPEVVQKLNSLSYAGQLMELGRIQASLTAKPAEPPSVSAAPKPLKPIKPASESGPKDPEDMSMDEYAEAARKRHGFADPMRPRGGPTTRH